MPSTIDKIIAFTNNDDSNISELTRNAINYISRISVANAQDVSNDCFDLQKLKVKIDNEPQLEKTKTISDENLYSVQIENIFFDNPEINSLFRENLNQILFNIRQIYALRIFDFFKLKKIEKMNVLNLLDECQNHKEIVECKRKIVENLTKNKNQKISEIII